MVKLRDAWDLQGLHGHKGKIRLLDWLLLRCICCSRSVKGLVKASHILTSFKWPCHMIRCKQVSMLEDRCDCTNHVSDELLYEQVLVEDRKDNAAQIEAEDHQRRGQYVTSPYQCPDRV